MTLRQGDRGPLVETLQLKLKAAGYSPGDVDGDFGPSTEKAVFAFQADRPELDDDGVAGPQTLGTLDAAVAKCKPASDVTPTPPQFVPANAETWAAFQQLVASLTAVPVRYGPGRGLWVDGKFVVTYGAGMLHGTVAQWPNVLNTPYPSFHCTSFTNFFLSWLMRRNQDFTHAGNIPSLFELVEGGPELHQAPGAGPWRGFGDVCFRITPDGSGSKRSGVPNVLDMQELYDRRSSMPTFVVCCQSDKRADGTWNWWHHTVLFVFYGGRMFRIAADGYRSAGGYSAKAMQYTEITDTTVSHGSPVYRAYGVNTVDGSYGDHTRPIAPVTFE